MVLMQLKAILDISTFRLAFVLMDKQFKHLKCYFVGVTILVALTFFWYKDRPYQKSLIPTRYFRVSLVKYHWTTTIQFNKLNFRNTRCQFKTIKLQQIIYLIYLSIMNFCSG
jgi:hypothetical protein